MRKLFWLMVLMTSIAGAQPRGPEAVTGEAVLDRDSIAQGSQFRVALVARIKEGFHLQAPQPPEGFIPTTLTVEAPEGFTVVRVWYPPTEEKTILGRQLPLYEGQQLFAALVQVGDSVAPGDYQLTMSLRYQACDDKACFPPRTFKVTVPVKVVPPEVPVRFINEEVFGKLPKDLTGGQEPTAQKELAEEPVPASAAQQYAVEAAERFQVRGLPTVVFIGSDGKERKELRLEGFEPPEEFLKRLRALKGEQPFEEPKGIASLIGGAFRRGQTGLLLLLVFVGGFLMNLSPCVFPMVPIVIGYFGRQAEGLWNRRLALGLAFLLGLVVMYGTLGFVAAATRSLFSGWLQNPWVLATITAILFALALSMFGLFEFATPQSAAKGFQAGVQLVGAQKFAVKLVGAFLMGLLIGVVAAPCVGPAVAALLGLAPLLDAFVLFLLFVVLALGLGLPYLFLAVFVSAVQRLRSGAWNLWVNRLMGVILLLAALYFAYQTAAAFGLRRGEHPWAPYTPQAVEQARLAGKPVVIDFWATWCIACKELEHKTFSDPRVKEALKDVVTLQVDMTSVR